MKDKKEDRATQLSALIRLHTGEPVTAEDFMGLDDKMLAVLESFGRVFITHYVIGKGGSNYEHE